MGLLGPRESTSALERHVLDCLRASVGVVGTDRDAYDLGSGAGLPGVVVAIVHPDLRVALVESRRRRVAWLEYVADELGLANVALLHRRVEELSSPADVCFSRAFAPIERSWELAWPVLRPGGRLVYFAGRRVDLSRAVRLSKDVRVVSESPLESSGPLVIIARQ